MTRLALTAADLAAWQAYVTANARTSHAYRTRLDPVAACVDCGIPLALPPESKRVTHVRKVCRWCRWHRGHDCTLRKRPRAELETGRRRKATR